MRAQTLFVPVRLFGDPLPRTIAEKRLWYTTHNITAHLAPGENVLGFTVSGGWDSRHGSGKNGNSVLVRLSMDLADGMHVDIVSDTSFVSGSSPHPALTPISTHHTSPPHTN